MGTPRSKLLRRASEVRTQKGTVIRRSRLGVGKDIGGDIYLHRNYAEVLPDQEGLKQAEARLPQGFTFNVIKAAKDGSAYTFFNSPDFDTADEPVAGEYVRVTAEGSAKPGKTGSIWHHKWLWVGDDYKGFDVEKSKARSRAWLSLPDIDFNRIGNKAFWEKEVVPNIPQV